MGIHRHTDKHIHTYTYKHIQTYTNIYIHIHTLTYIYMKELLSGPVRTPASHRDCMWVCCYVSKMEDSELLSIVSEGSRGHFKGHLVHFESHHPQLHEPFHIQENNLPCFHFWKSYLSQVPCQVFYIYHLILLSQ